MTKADWELMITEACLMVEGFCPGNNIAGWVEHFDRESDVEYQRLLGRRVEPWVRCMFVAWSIEAQIHGVENPWRKKIGVI